MTIGERIRLVRETSQSKKLSMAAFAEKLSVSPGAVSQWENNQRTPSNIVLHTISKEFSINENWLRTGENEMRTPITREQEIAEMVAALIKNDDIKKSELQKLVLDMTDTQIEFLYTTAQKWINEVEKNGRPD